MSGLAQFLGDFIASPPDKKDVVTKDSGVDGMEAGQSTVDYRVSLASVTPSGDNVPIESKRVEGEETSFTDWKTMRNEMLTTFCGKRFFEPSEENEEEGEEDLEDIPDTETTETSQVLDTQLTQEGQTANPKPPVRKRLRVPRCEETLHHVSTVSSIDLYSKSIDLSLCKAEKVFPLRELKRLAKLKGSIPPPLKGSLLDLPQFRPHAQDDGPLATIYKQVLSMELTQLRDPIATRTGNASAAVFSETVPKRRIKVFFYNKYAMSVAKFLKDDASIVLLSLKQIPAKCVFPHPVEHDNWFDQDVADYCICIGDKSSMKLTTSDDGKSTRIYFDSDEVFLTIAKTTAPATKSLQDTVEVGLDRKSVVASEFVEQNEHRLFAAYREWKKPEKAATIDSGQTQGTPTREQPSNKKKASDVAGAPPTVSPVEVVNVDGELTDVPDGQNTPNSTTTKRRSDKADERPMKKAKSTTKYIKLNQLMNVFQEFNNSPIEARPNFPTINVYGLVLGFGSPTLTKTNNWMVSMTIIDESLPIPADSRKDFHAHTINFFHNSKDKLPKLYEAGSVIRLNGAGLQEYLGELQLLGRTGTSHLVFQNEEGTSDNNVNSMKFGGLGTGEQLSPEEVARFMALWEWGQKRLLANPTMKVSQSLSLVDVGQEEYDQQEGFDATALVTAKFEVPEDYKPGQPHPCGFLRIWDGTGPGVCAELPIDTVNAETTRNPGDPPSFAVGRIAEAIDRITASDSPRVPTGFAAPKSLCGMVMNLAIWEESHWDYVKKHVTTGKFIRLRNIKLGQLFDSTKCLMVASKSWITPLPDSTFEVLALLKDHAERIRRKEPFNPTSGVLPLNVKEAINQEAAADTSRLTNGAKDTPETAAAEETASKSKITNCIEDEAPSSHEIKFRIVRITPDIASDLSSLCKGGSQYQFVARLKDSTGEIDAIVANESGEALLGMTATEARTAGAALSNQKRRDVTTFTWRGIVCSVDLHGQKFFVLESVDGRV